MDGAVLSTFPVWIFDTCDKPRWPTFGIKLVESEKSHTASGKTDSVSFLLDIVSTMVDEDKARYIKNKDIVRTIPIPTVGVRTTEFDISREKSKELFNSGYESAGEFIKKWNLDRYIAKYRSGKTPSRVESLWADSKL